MFVKKMCKCLFDDEFLENAFAKHSVDEKHVISHMLMYVFLVKEYMLYHTYLPPMQIRKILNSSHV